jgi:transposase
MTGEAQTALKILENEPPGWRRDRLLALRHGIEGKMDLDEIAKTVGRARSSIQRWFDYYREGGLDRLLRREHGGGSVSYLEPSIIRAMENEFRKGAWHKGADAQQWLEKEYGVKLTLTTIYKYLKKFANASGDPDPFPLYRGNPPSTHATNPGLDIGNHSEFLIPVSQYA